MNPLPTDGAPTGADPSYAELLAGCAREPIHIPGAIQPHGTLLGFDDRGIAVVASADAAHALDHSLDEIFGADAAAVLQREALGQPLNLTVTTGEQVDVVVHRSGALTIVEIEPPSDVDLEARVGVLEALRRLQGATSIEDLLARTTAAVRRLTGFDRVMVYRFDEQWIGEVVAEDCDADLDPFFGLRYPASDIPPQARALYLRNPIRLIPDSHHQPVPLVSVAEREGEPPLDLSDATLRAVSPVHLEYLRNMGVVTSMSAALVAEGRLWGLVACHHYDGVRRPSQRVRAAVDVVANTASALLVQLLATAAANRRFDLLQRLDSLNEHVVDADGDPADTLARAGAGLRDLVGADGAATWTPSGIAVIGDCPPDAAIDALVRAMAAADRDELVTNHASADPLIVPTGVAPLAAGVLALRAGKVSSSYVLWFRREQIESVRWGGDPTHKEMQRDPTGGVRLGPRRSFAEYVELVHERSAPWDDAEVDIARDLARRLGESTERQLRRDRVLAEAMQQAVLLDKLPDVPGADVAVLYEPATRFGVGGDWYDLFFLRDGRAVLALGDVAGHGFEVAATMAQLRHALRAYVVRTGDVGAAIAELNELVRTLLPGEMATAVVAVFSPDDRTIDILSAGHLPPVLVTGDQAALLTLPRHPALGLRRGIDFATTSVTLDESATLVLYTDGLIERRDIGLVERLDTLVEQAPLLRSDDLDAMCTNLRDTLRDEQREDDATVFAIRFRS